MDGKEIEEIDTEEETEKIEGEEEGSFAELFEQSPQTPYGRFSPGILDSGFRRNDGEKAFELLVNSSIFMENRKNIEFQTSCGMLIKKG